MEQNPALFDINLDQQNQVYLSETAKWAKFLAIIGFIFIGILVLMGFFAGSLFSNFYAASGMEYFGAGFFLFFYIAIALLYFFPTLFLYKFASSMQMALRNNDQIRLTDSFKNLKSCFKFIGIVTIVFIGFYVITIIIGIITGLASTL